MTPEDLTDIKNFILNHKDEYTRFEFAIGQDAVRQLEWWFAYNKPSEFHDAGFYKRVVGGLCWKFVSPNDDDWYDHPDDFPTFYEKMLFN